MNGLMQSSDPDWVETDLYAEFLKVLEEGITGLENHTAQEGNYLELIGYLDKKQNLKGHKLMVSSVDEAPFALLTWLTAEDGDAERVRIVLCEGEEETLLTGIGKQTEKDGVYNGTFELTFGDKQTLTLEMKDLHYNDQMLNGTIQLTPNIKLLKELLGDSYTSVRMMLGGELGLRLDLEGGMEAGSCGLHLTSEGESVIGLTVGAAYREGKPITLPEKDAILTGEEASTRWSEAMDLEALMKKLEEAGIPTELLESLEQSMTASAPVLPDEAA